jgi:hypothetical protein
MMCAFVIGAASGRGYVIVVPMFADPESVVPAANKPDSD